MNARFDPASPERFRDLIARTFGLTFDDGKLVFLGDVLKRRAEARALPLEVYLSQIETREMPDELGPLAEELTVGETYFFRNRDQFRAFAESVLPARTGARGDARTINLLSAGCSSGEEAYSLAITARETLPMPPWQVSIRAVDLNPAALRRAASGTYTSWSLRDTPPAAQQKWFTPKGRELVLDPTIQAAVRFDRRNLTEDDADLWAPNTYDAIFCRNVIMYFLPEVQQAVIGRITRALAPGGFLFLGHAETLRGLSQDFHLVHTHDTFYYQRKEEGDEAGPRHYVELPVFAPRTAAPLPPAATLADTTWYAAIGRATDRIQALTAPPEPVAKPPKPTWNLGAALELLQRERYTEALDEIHQMPSEAGDDPDVLLLRAALLVHGGKLAAAAETCRELLLRDELNSGANYVLALCFEGAGNREAATHHYRVASYLDPSFAMPQLHLGLLARRAGDLDEARNGLNRALELLRREDTSRLLLFGGGFTRDGLIALCQAELRGSEARA